VTLCDVIFIDTVLPVLTLKFKRKPYILSSTGCGEWKLIGLGGAVMGE
jgi:hypothetical protein